MKIPVIHLGGERCVTGSCHLLQVHGMNILVDCGMTQGRDRRLALSEWPVTVGELDYVFLTHAHVDHIGLLPELVAAGFGGEVICSHPTKRLIMPMLNDAMRFGDIAEKDRDRISERIEALSWGFEYGQRFELGKGVRFELGRAGHILGSCFVRFECGREGFSILFSGDLGNRDAPLLCDPDRAQSADFMVLESTYGDRLHGDRTRRVERLAAVLDRCLRDGGKVYIPAFALGRTQEMLYELDRVFSEGAFSDRYPSLAEGVRPPVFVDTPLGLEITEIYSSLSEYWDREAGTFLAGGDHPLDFKGLFAVERHFQHEQLMAVEGPAVIIAGSGMCTGGRMVNHLAQGIGDARNDVVLVGYMAEGTPGRAIQEDKKSVVLDGVALDVRAGVHVLSGYSAHADRQGLLDWVGAMEGRPGMIRLVHGDDGARRDLGDALVGLGYSVG